jgi:predicted RNA-binding protein with RPS1 domain
LDALRRLRDPARPRAPSPRLPRASAPGLAGLVHVSEIADERVNDPNDYLTEGQIVDVKVMEVDRFGKIKLSIRAIAPLAKKAK